MSKSDTRKRIEYAHRREVHLDAPLTRRALIESIEAVATDFGGNGTHDGDLISDAFRRLAHHLELF